MKAEESKNYYCPQSLANGGKERCHGMECAAWRWSEPKWGSSAQRKGYCGLAGETKYPLNPEHECG